MLNKHWLLLHTFLNPSTLRLIEKNTPLTTPCSGKVLPLPPAVRQREKRGSIVRSVTCEVGKQDSQGASCL